MLELVPGDPGDNIDPFPFAFLVSPPLSLFFLNLAMNPFKLGPELEGMGVGETRGSTVTVAADKTDNDPLCSVLAIETSPGWIEGWLSMFGEVAGEIDVVGLRSAGKGETSSPLGMGLPLSVPLNFLNLCPSRNVPDELSPDPELGGSIGVVGCVAIVSTLMDADNSVGLEI